MSFPSNSPFEVSADQARERIAATNLAGVVAQHNNLLRNVDMWGRHLQSWADELDDVIFELAEDDVQLEELEDRLQGVARNMEVMLRSIRNASANHPDSNSRSGKDHVDPKRVPAVHSNQ